MTEKTSGNSSDFPIIYTDSYKQRLNRRVTELDAHSGLLNLGPIYNCVTSTGKNISITTIYTHENYEDGNNKTLIWLFPQDNEGNILGDLKVSISYYSLPDSTMVESAVEIIPKAEGIATLTYFALLDLLSMEASRRNSSLTWKISNQNLLDLQRLEHERDELLELSEISAIQKQITAYDILIAEKQAEQVAWRKLVYDTLGFTPLLVRDIIPPATPYERLNGQVVNLTRQGKISLYQNTDEIIDENITIASILNKLRLLAKK